MDDSDRAMARTVLILEGQGSNPQEKVQVPSSLVLDFQWDYTIHG